MVRKVVLTMMSVILTFGVIIGCSSNTNNSSSSNSGAPAQSSGSSDDSTPAKAPAPKLKIALGTNHLPYIEGSSNINNDVITKKLNELSGFDVSYELIPENEFAERMTLLLAGGDYPDIIGANGLGQAYMTPALDANVFLPLDDLIKEHAPNILKNMPEEAWIQPEVAYKGKIYSIPSTHSILNERVVLIRKDWLDKLNLEIPVTVEDYVEVMRAFRDGDPNENGKADELPTSGRESLAWAEMFFGAYNVLFNGWRELDGKIVPSTVHPDMKDALNLYQMLYTEKLLDNEVFVNKKQDVQDKVVGAGIVGMWLAGASDVANVQKQFIENGHTDAEVIAIPAPIGPDGKGGLFRRSFIATDVFVIPASTKDPVAAIKYLDWFYSDEAQNFFMWGVDKNGEINTAGTFEYDVDDKAWLDQHVAIEDFFKLIGPGSRLVNEEYMKHVPGGEEISKAIEIVNNEGRSLNNYGMPLLPAYTNDPDLFYRGYWLEYAAKAITGVVNVDDTFDSFVADWYAKGGQNWVDQASEWYYSR